nr:flagellar brake domain-containing protein [uncultured Dethiosulfovibrio sp.]
MEASRLIESDPSVIGAKAEISIQTGLYKGEYPSRLENVEGSVWKMGHPFLGGGLLPLYRGVEVVLSVKSDGSVYRATGSVLGTVREGEVVMLVLQILGAVEKIQRRQFLRVSCLLDGKVAPLGEPPRIGGEGWLDGSITDISLGGARLSIPGRQGPAFDGVSRAILRVNVEKERFYIPCKVAMARFIDETENTDLGLAFEILPGLVEKALGRFVRHQELASRSDRR